MCAKSDERERRRCYYGDGQPCGPALLHPQPATGDDICESGYKVEPEHELHIISGSGARCLVAKQNRAAFLDG